MKALILVFLATMSFLSYAEMEGVPLIKTEDGHFEVHASINDVKAKFILDTGVTGTVIFSQNLDVFGIKTNKNRIDGVRIGDADAGKIATMPVDIAQFSIGKKQLRLKSIFSNDSSSRFTPEVMGIIGNDALIELNALLDVKNAKLLLPDGQTDLDKFLTATSDKPYNIVTLQKSPMGFSFVDALLAERKVRLLVDTGAPEIVLDESVLKSFGLDLQDHPTAKTVIGDGIELPMKVFKNGLITFGHTTISDDFFTTDFTALMNAVNVEDQPRLIGVLGNKHLAQMSTIIDVASAKLYIKP
ncbi:MAG: pepsin/retropepsin-like aspartic protease family protein [Paraglaciecola sp.]|uniref:pepsin/retropepsin-like aspartic protease family protein n=1 Tax=Paraglaciecola sp. TaxID=1920173 RepID=UPI0032995B67